MHTDLEALEVVCKHYKAMHGTECLRQQKNKVRQLQRKRMKAESDRARLTRSVYVLQNYITRMHAFLDKLQSLANSLSQLARQRNQKRYADAL